MSLWESIRSLIRDAKSVWGDPSARRPFTRRGVSEKELLEEYRKSREDEGKKPSQADRPEREDN